MEQIYVYIYIVIIKRVITSELYVTLYPCRHRIVCGDSLSGSDLEVVMIVGGLPLLISKKQLPVLCPSIIHLSLYGRSESMRGPVRHILRLLGPLASTFVVPPTKKLMSWDTTHPS